MKAHIHFPGFWLLVLILLSSAVAHPGKPSQITPASAINLRSNKVSSVPRQYYPYQWFPRAGSLQSAANAIAARVFYEEAIALATYVFVAISATDPVFLQFFEPGDYPLVKGIFEAISGAADGNIQYGSKKFPLMHLYEGSSPYLRGSQVNICETYATREGIDAVTNQNRPNQPVRMPQGQVAISMCPTFFLWPSLMHMTCDCLGDTYSYRMVSGGSTLLHEIVHWIFMDQTAPNWSSVRQGIIIDYTPNAAFPEPPSGYGPLHTTQLVEHANGDARENADNYRWLALAMYWKDRCPGKTLLPAVDNWAGVPEQIMAVVAAAQPATDELGDLSAGELRWMILNGSY